jgi:hypothetical protein
MNEILFEKYNSNGRVVPIENPFSAETSLEAVLAGLAYEVDPDGVMEQGDLFVDGIKSVASSTLKLGECVGRVEYRDKTNRCLAWKKGQTRR